MWGNNTVHLEYADYNKVFSMQYIWYLPFEYHALQCDKNGNPNITCLK